jgi:hypothetical protein
MAVVIRESGVWKSVHGTLTKDGIQVTTISELPQALKTQKEAQAEATKAFEKENKELQAQFSNALKKLSQEHDKLIGSIRERYNREVKTLNQQIEAIQEQASELREKSILVRLFQMGRIITLWQEGKSLKSKRQKSLRSLDKEIKLQEKAYKDTKQKFQKKNANYQFEIEKKVKIAQKRVAILDEVLNSGSYYGALAELKMVDLLGKLPDNYYVLNDVTIRLYKSVHFDGKWLSSSQIDHLVIGPAGAFVIEVKNWSEKFSVEGEFFDPYQQVKRHNYVCYTLLNQQFKTKVRSIIAYAGHIPTKPDNSYAKVLPLEQVNSHILRFKDVKHDDEEIQRIVQFIERIIQ